MTHIIPFKLLFLYIAQCLSNVLSATPPRRFFNHFCSLLARQHSQPVGQPVNYLVTHGRSLNIFHFCWGRPLQHFNLRLYETQRRLFLAIRTIVSAHCRIALKIYQCPTITRHTSAFCKALSQPPRGPSQDFNVVRELETYPFPSPIT